MQQPVVSCRMPTEEIESVSLPVGWKSYISPEGRKYYVNTSTKETTWERPSTSTTSPKASGFHQHSALREGEGQLIEELHCTTAFVIIITHHWTQSVDTYTQAVQP
ncbi:growth arrest-specific protein 7-like [Carassius auratus]|uniref:Growth arrest-specific protein 7-like n=1 Tax=Carassius auratus TaxID=7957 RepID=A0A6P6JUI7_CARAU|nr:growth arrest-specific protein 7-like [Carassius auratus]